MANTLQDIDFDFGWIWAKANKSTQSQLEFLESGLAKFRDKFRREPSFALVSIKDDYIPEELENLEFPVYQSQYALKSHVILCVKANFSDSATENFQTP